MNTQVHPHALKHGLSPNEIQYAWNATTKCIKRKGDDEPARWIAIGWLPDGRDVELVAVEIVTGWLIIHALSPVQPTFAREIERAERRLR